MDGSKDGGAVEITCHQPHAVMPAEGVGEGEGGLPAYHIQSIASHRIIALFNDLWRRGRWRRLSTRRDRMTTRA